MRCVYHDAARPWPQDAAVDHPHKQTEIHFGTVSTGRSGVPVLVPGDVNGPLRLRADGDSMPVLPLISGSSGYP